MQTPERTQWQKDLSSTVRAILSEPEAQKSRARRQTFEEWRESMSAEFGIGVLDRDFSKEEMVRFRPLAEVIRDATDVKLVQEKLIELLHAVTKPGTKYLAPTRWKQKPNERPGTALEPRIQGEQKRSLFPEYEASSFVKALAVQHRRRKQYQAFIRQKHQQELATPAPTQDDVEMQHSLAIHHLSDRMRLIYQV